MKIWHIGAGGSSNDVNGVNYAIWAIAKAQVAHGHEVSLVISDKLDRETRRAAVAGGIKTLEIPASKLRYKTPLIREVIAENTPHVVHFHSVFIPRQATLARQFRRARVPYIVTPHGGVSPHILKRSRLMKSLYSSFIERPRFMRAAAITVVLPKEIEEVKAFAPRFKGAIDYVANPIGGELFSEKPTHLPLPRKKIVYLGRFDVEHKGIDILLEIAAQLPEADFHLYGADDVKTFAQLENLRKKKTANVHFHRPVYAAEKAQVLVNADLYLQTSRWEAFGISIAEAMACGLPCAVSEKMHIAELFEVEKLGLVLPVATTQAAAKIREVLNAPQALADFSRKARKYALENFSAERIAAKYLEIYGEAVRKHALQKGTAAESYAEQKSSPAFLSDKTTSAEREFSEINIPVKFK